MRARFASEFSKKGTWPLMILTFVFWLPAGAKSVYLSIVDQPDPFYNSASYWVIAAGAFLIKGLLILSCYKSQMFGIIGLPVFFALNLVAIVTITEPPTKFTIELIVRMVAFALAISASYLRYSEMKRQTPINPLDPLS